MSANAFANEEQFNDSYRQLYSMNLAGNHRHMPMSLHKALPGLVFSKPIGIHQAARVYGPGPIMSGNDSPVPVGGRYGPGPVISSKNPIYGPGPVMDPYREPGPIIQPPNYSGTGPVVTRAGSHMAPVGPVLSPASSPKGFKPVHISGPGPAKTKKGKDLPIVLIAGGAVVAYLLMSR